MLENCVGIVYCESERRVCCIEGSNVYKRIYRRRKDIQIVPIPAYQFDSLMRKNPNIGEWDIKKIKRLK